MRLKPHLQLWVVGLNWIDRLGEIASIVEILEFSLSYRLGMARSDELGKL